MTILSGLLFSLFWGGIVWLVMTACFHGRLDRLCSPGAMLVAIASVVAPSILVASGWTIPVGTQQVPINALGGTGQNLMEMTASVGRLAREPAWRGEAWMPAFILTLYAAGLTAHLASVMVRCQRLALLLRKTRPADEFKADWPVLVTSETAAPFAVGRPFASIVLPDHLVRTWPKDRIAMIIDHECGHLRHRDPEIALGLEFCAALFWFNPFVRDLVARWRSGCEMRADSIALENANPPQRKTYAGTLLEAKRIAGDSAGGVFSPSFTTRSIRNDKMRITAILNGYHASGRRLRTIIAHCLAIALVAIGSAGALATTSVSVVSMDAFVPGGRVVSPFGIKRLNKRDHTGIDVAAQMRTPIAAPADAVVVQATDLFRGNWRWGKAVVLRFDDGLVGWFTHLDSYWVKPGDTVEKGAYFGTIGSTGLSSGPHVHIEVYDGAERVDPATVWPFLKMSGR